MANLIFFTLFTLSLGRFSRFFDHNFPKQVPTQDICPKVKCLSSNVQIQNDICVHPDPDTNTIYTQLCPQGYTCKPNSFRPQSDVRCQPKVDDSYTKVPYLYPGERCVQGDCIYGDCIEGICEGFTEQSECTTHGQCNPGLRCSYNHCISQLYPGQSGCLNDYDCINSSGCNRTSTAPGICMPYFSGQLGEEIGECDLYDSLSMLCESLDCEANEEGTYRCTDGIVSNDQMPVKCETKQDCTGSNSQGFTVTSDCQCGLNPEGESYCFPHDGDAVSVQFERAFMDFMGTGALEKCNTLRRFTIYCWDVSYGSEELWDALTSFYEFYFYPYFQNNDVCTYNVFHEPYVFKSASLAAAGLFLLIVSQKW